jgi:hypothetical protein
LCNYSARLFFCHKMIGLDVRINDFNHVCEVILLVGFKFQPMQFSKIFK